MKMVRIDYNNYCINLYIATDFISRNNPPGVLQSGGSYTTKAVIINMATN